MHYGYLLIVSNHLMTMVLNIYQLKDSLLRITKRNFSMRKLFLNLFTSCETRRLDFCDDGGVVIDDTKNFSCRCKRLALTSCKRAARSSSVRIKSFCIPTAKHLTKRHVGHCRRVRSLTGHWPPKRQGGKV